MNSVENIIEKCLGKQTYIKIVMLSTMVCTKAA